MITEETSDKVKVGLWGGGGGGGAERKRRKTTERKMKGREKMTSILTCVMHTRSE